MVDNDQDNKNNNINKFANAVVSFVLLVCFIFGIYKTYKCSGSFLQYIAAIFLEPFYLIYYYFIKKIKNKKLLEKIKDTKDMKNVCYKINKNYIPPKN